MDDLLDLDWSQSHTAASSTSPPMAPRGPGLPKQNKPKDAFADLLTLDSQQTPDMSKLSLAEQQQYQYQEHMKTLDRHRRPSASPPIEVTPKNTISSSSKTVKSPPISESHHRDAFDSLLAPLTGGSRRTEQVPTKTLNDLSRTPDILSNGSKADICNSHSHSDSPDPWDFDLLQSNTKPGQPSYNTQAAADPFDIDFFANSPAKSKGKVSPDRSSDTMSSSFIDEDNPLGILSEPVTTNSTPVVNEAFDDENEFADKESLNSQSLQDNLLAQLMDMGFESGVAKAALDATGGKDVQAAVDFLVQQATVLDQVKRTKNAGETRKDKHARDTVEARAHSADSLHHHTERFMTQATELGGFLYKKGSFFVKTSTQKITKAVEEWQDTKAPNGTPSKPRWMTEDATPIEDEVTLERFVDSDDEDMPNQPKAEPTAYVSPARRRPATQSPSSRSSTTSPLISTPKASTPKAPTPKAPTPKAPTPKVSTSQTSTPKASTLKPPTPKIPPRSRPVVAASSDAMATAAQERLAGNENFKLGQFTLAEEAYSRAINALPHGHDCLAPLHNNRATARYKSGDYKRCIDDCAVVIDMARTSGETVTVINDTEIRWRDQLIKSLNLQAQVYERLEKYDEAIRVLEDIQRVEGSANSKTQHALSRCRKALRPPSETKRSAPKASTASSTPTTKPFPQKSEAVKALREKAAQQEAEETERLERMDDVNERILEWKKGKEDNLRALLATMDMLMWEGAHWTGTSLSELIEPKRCKIAYMKAISKVHPDKLPQTVTVEQRMIANGIFSTLNEAWDIFKAKHM